MGARPGCVGIGSRLHGRAARLAATLLTGLALAPLAGTSPAVAGIGSQRRVLMLNAYNSTYPWTASVVEGARSVFDKTDDVELSTEFLDAKRIFTPAYIAQMAGVYAQKYGNASLDLILASDDDALD